jgi:hypothetical protein
MIKSQNQSATASFVGADRGMTIFNGSCSLMEADAKER